MLPFRISNLVDKMDLREPGHPISAYEALLGRDARLV
jgi:hypothetical protein